MAPPTVPAALQSVLAQVAAPELPHIPAQPAPRVRHVLPAQPPLPRPDPLAQKRHPAARRKGARLPLVQPQPARRQPPRDGLAPPGQLRLGVAEQQKIIHIPHIPGAAQRLLHPMVKLRQIDAPEPLARQVPDRQPHPPPRGVHQVVSANIPSIRCRNRV